MRTLLIILMLSLPISAQAEDICKTMATVAGITMESRQKGVPMDKVIAVYRGIKETNPKVYEAFKSFAIVAYETPRFSTEEMQKRAVEDYYNSVYLRCIKEE